MNWKNDESLLRSPWSRFGMPKDNSVFHDRNNLEDARGGATGPSKKTLAGPKGLGKLGG